MEEKQRKQMTVKDGGKERERKEGSLMKKKRDK